MQREDRSKVSGRSTRYEQHFLFGINAAKDVRSYIPHIFDGLAKQLQDQLKSSEGYTLLDAECTKMCTEMDDVSNLKNQYFLFC